MDEDAIDEMCEEIAQSYIEAGASMMLGMCGNAGQESIIGNSIDSYYELAEGASQGEVDSFSTDHDDAVSIIIDAGMEFVEAAADICAQIRAAADVAELIF